MSEREDRQMNVVARTHGRSMLQAILIVSCTMVGLRINSSLVVNENATSPMEHQPI